jgi:coronin-1B/1C/6
MKVASEPTPLSASASGYAYTPISPAEVQIPPSRSASTCVSDVCSFSLPPSLDLFIYLVAQNYVQDRKAASIALQEDNERLNADLREAREQIRNLELQVESLKANARRAAATLLDK